MNICEHLTATARICPQREALRFEGRTYSFELLDRLSACAAERLTAAGVGRGDRVALMLPNVPAFVVWYYATLRLGGIAVSISTRAAEAETVFVVDDCGATVFVTNEAGPALPLQSTEAQSAKCLTTTFRVDESGRRCDGITLDPAGVEAETWVETAPDDAALILYTSGTTGFPKGATLSHMNVRSNVHAFNHLCNMQPDDRILLAVPVFHCFGQNALLNSALNVGATLVLQRRFDFDEARSLIAAEQVTQLYGVPMMFQLFLDRCDQADLQSVNYCFSAAAPLPIQVSRRWLEKFGLPINEGYGLTETSPFASYNHRLRYVPGSIGTPIDAVEMRIMDPESGGVCPPDELGEIVVRGPNVMLGYWNREQDTRAAIRDGWFHTGDIGRVDELGFFYIVDRLKDMIAVGGLKAYPAEVERVLLDHECISQAAVVGIPDDVFGEQVVAFVVLTAAVENVEDQLAGVWQHARQNLAAYKVPRVIVPTDALPRNPSGKVLKTELRQYDLRGATGKTGTAADAAGDDRGATSFGEPFSDREPTLRRQLQDTHAAARRGVTHRFVQELVRDVSGGNELPEPETRFTDAGLDSLMIVELSQRIQTEVGGDQQVQATLVFDHPRLADLGDYLLTVLTPESSAAERAESEPGAGGDSASGEPTGAGDLQREIESLTEDEALAELMRELDS